MQNDVRLFFTKTGFAKYISHLDLMRCMSRAVKRAGQARIEVVRDMHPIRHGGTQKPRIEADACQDDCLCAEPVQIGDKPLQLGLRISF